ncbi:MAG: apolipoprotein N-acyltransferase [Acidobacteriia bacterium]|nr:apolipoprotein N-acyltransferase [Terriglobia bacterium]
MAELQSIFQDRNPRQRLALSVLSGILLALVFPKFNLNWLCWFALLPLFFVLLQPISLKSALGYTTLSGVVFYAILLYWVMQVIHQYGEQSWPIAALVWLVLVAYNALFFAVFGFLARKLLIQNYFLGSMLRPSVIQISVLNSLVVAALWVAVEFARTYFLTGFPWCLLGYGLVKQLGIMQVATVTGIYGISFLICLVNLLLAHALYQKKQPLFFGAAILLGLVLTGDFGFHAWLVQHPFEYVPETTQLPASVHRVAILQLNIPQDTDWGPTTLDAWVSKLDEMIQHSQAELIVMPENPAPFYLPDDPRFTRELRFATQQAGATVVAGVIMGHKTQSGNAGVFNSAATLDPSGRLTSEYDKRHLVPFGEYIPWRNVVSWAGKLTQEVSDFSPGENYTLSLINQNRAAVMICYEAIFPHLVRQFTRRGAEVLINITNDGWYGFSAAPYQHFEMARVRAIENRRYLIRAANTGISAIVDPYGRVLDQTALGQQSILRGVYEYRTDMTIYARFGDVFAWICVLLSIVFLAWGFAKRIR